MIGVEVRRALKCLIFCGCAQGMANENNTTHFLAVESAFQKTAPAEENLWVLLCAVLKKKQISG